MYIVRFIMIDDSTHEDYYYQNPNEAIKQFKLFANKTSDVYKRIQLIFFEEKEIIVIEHIY